MKIVIAGSLDRSIILNSYVALAIRLVVDMRGSSWPALSALQGSNKCGPCNVSEYEQIQ